MKRKGLFLLVLIVFSLKGIAQEIQWYEWNEGYELSKKEGKKIMVFAQADWCHICKRMKDKTFSDEGVINLLSQDFIAIKLTVDEEATYIIDNSELSTKELVKKLFSGQQVGIPTVFFMDNEFKKIKKEGFNLPDDFTPIVKKYAKRL